MPGFKRQHSIPASRYPWSPHRPVSHSSPCPHCLDPCILITLCPHTPLVSPISLPPDVPSISVSPLHPHRLVFPTYSMFPLSPGCCPCPQNALVPTTLHPLLPCSLPPPLHLHAKPSGLAMTQWLKTRVANP